MLPLLSLVALLAAPATATTTPAEPLYEAWFSVRARVRSPLLDADLEAGGRLSMTADRERDGTLHLSLADVAESPWKLYWIDPWRPFAEEVKVASVETLPELSWEALAAARERAEARGRSRHRGWLERADRPRELDDTFAFLVIGDPRDRFTLRARPGGALAATANRLTDRWLPGPFEQFVGRGPSGAGNGAAPEGYWFWNRGEAEPFHFEPHTYHAFEAALQLLELELPRPEARTVLWPGLSERTVRVLTTLAPRLGTAGFLEPSTAPARLSVRAVAQEDGGVRTHLTGTAPGPSVERETVFSSEGQPVSDRIRVRLESQPRGHLEIEAGYGPEEPE